MIRQYMYCDLQLIKVKCLRIRKNVSVKVGSYYWFWFMIGKLREMKQKQILWGFSEVSRLVFAYLKMSLVLKFKFCWNDHYNMQLYCPISVITSSVELLRHQLMMGYQGPSVLSRDAVLCPSISYLLPKSWTCEFHKGQ